MSKQICYGMARLILIFIASILLLSCRTHRETEKTRESVRTDTIVLFHTDTLYKSVLRTDSIYLHEAERIRENGDTVYVERTTTKYSDRLLHDTIYRSRTDTLYESRTDTLRLTDHQTVTRTKKDWPFSFWMLAAGLLIGGGVVMWKMKR